MRGRSNGERLQRAGNICHAWFLFLNSVLLKLYLHRALKRRMRSLHRIIQPYLPNQLKTVEDGLIYERIIWASSRFSSSCDHLIILLYEFSTAWKDLTTAFIAASCQCVMWDVQWSGKSMQMGAIVQIIQEKEKKKHL